METHYLNGLFQRMMQIKKQKLYTEKKKFCAFIVQNRDAQDRIKFLKNYLNIKKWIRMEVA